MIVTGCTGPGENPGQHSSTSTPATSTPPTATATSSTSSGTPYLPSPIPELPDPAAPTGDLEQLSGVITEGAEPGCTLLQLGRGEAVLLLGAVPRLAPGTQAVVEGHHRPHQATTCQQGRPFVVTRVVHARS